MGGFLFCVYSDSGDEASRFYQHFDILRYDFQQFDILRAVAQSCELHTMGIGEQKERCKDVFIINRAAFVNQHEIKRNAKRIQEKTNEIRLRRIKLAPSSLKSGQWDSISGRMKLGIPKIRFNRKSKKT